MTKKTKETARFRATGDDGKEYVIQVLTEFIDSELPDEPPVDVRQVLVTWDGIPVKRITKGEYLISLRGIVLRSDSVNAP